MTERIHARYWIETAFPLDSAAATMAGEQSTGTFLRVPGETDELRERFAARVESIAKLDTVKIPSLPGSGVPKGTSPDALRRTAEVTLSWPIETMGPSLPNVLATVAGNLSELKQFSGLKLLDITLPPVFLTKYQGPQFGVAGTRVFTGVQDPPHHRHHHQTICRNDTRHNRRPSQVLGSGLPYLKGKVCSVSLLGSNAPIAFTQKPEGMFLTLPTQKPNYIAYVFRIHPC